MRIANIYGRNLVIIANGKQFPTFSGAKLHKSASVNVVNQAELINNEKFGFGIFGQAIEIEIAFELEGRVNGFVEIAQRFVFIFQEKRIDGVAV